MEELIKDDMIFKPYLTMGGWQCIMETKRGKISIRLGGYGCFASKDKPYEVWYPTEDTPIGEQSADDIWNYVRGGNVL
jgi:hypothetical protein